MKYITKFLDKTTKLIENVNVHHTHIKNLGELVIPDPQYGDLKLSVMPFENTGKFVSLPEGFKIWEESFNKILKMIPLQEGANTHYITIDTKFFTTDEFLRREGVHVDGNFCVDPNFQTLNETTVEDVLSDDFFSSEEDIEDDVEMKSSWGGASPKPTWGGAKMKSSWGGATWGGAKAKYNKYVVQEDNSHVQMDWVLPYKLVIPIADYISEKKGGILTVSTEVGCQAWGGTFKGEILSEGSFEKMNDQLVDERKVVFEKNQLYFMTSNTPHETLLINKGKRRTFMRITLNHNYNNELLRQ